MAAKAGFLNGKIKRAEKARLDEPCFFAPRHMAAKKYRNISAGVKLPRKYIRLLAPSVVLDFYL